MANDLILRLMGLAGREAFFRTYRPLGCFRTYPGQKTGSADEPGGPYCTVRPGGPPAPYAGAGYRDVPPEEVESGPVRPIGIWPDWLATGAEYGPLLGADAGFPPVSSYWLP